MNLWNWTLFKRVSDIGAKPPDVDHKLSHVQTYSVAAVFLDNLLPLTGL